MLEKTTAACKCQKSRICPLPRMFLSEGVIYSPRLTAAKCESPFESRYGGHLSTLKHEDANQTTLSTHVLDLKRAKTPHTVDLDILARSKGFNPS